MKRYLALGLFLIIGSCYEIIDIEVATDGQYIVSAFVNISADSNAVELSKFNEQGLQVPQDDFNVQLITTSGAEFEFNSVGNGVYVYKGLIKSSDSLRLILSSNNTVIQSDWERPGNPIEITNLTYDYHSEIYYDERGKELELQLLDFYVSLVGDGKYQALIDYTGIYKVTSLPVESRPISPVCWFNDPSVNFLNPIAGNSESKQLVVARRPMAIFDKYNLEIRISSINEKAYFFWNEINNLRTMDGGLFDPVPSEIPGNVHVINGDDKVLGYFTLINRSSKIYPIKGAKDLPIPISLSECVSGFFNNTRIGPECFDCRLINPLDTLPPSTWIEP